MSDSSSGIQTFFGILLCAYIISTQIAAVVFWVDYVKTDSIIMALTLDPIIAELKGLVWPFFL